MRIVTEFYQPPIPIRKFDWSAIDADTYDADLVDGEIVGGPCGYGATEQEAIDDLMERLNLSAVDALDLVRESEESEMNQ